jgi:uncharacterized protein (TIGR03118 family)
MKTISVPFHFRSFGAALAVAGLQFSSAVLPSAYAQAQDAKAQPNFFDWENLQTDVPGVADRTDTHLVNPWGLTINTKANVFWVSDNNADVSTLYQPDGTPIPLVVSIPQGAPTGIVFNAIPNAFKLSEDGQPAAFIFDSENGSITAWNGGLQPITKAVIKFDNSASGAVYKGLTLAVRKNGEPTLYAANFNKGTVDVFDSHFAPEKLAGNFVDPNPPPVPKGTFGWAPFDLASIEGNIYVTFAAQNQLKHDDLAGAGRGFVDVFDSEGHLLKRLITGGQLNSPWGLAKVPEHQHFGKFDDEVLLVGNFGDGNINAYDVHTGTFIATLSRRTDQPLQFNGLWSLFFFDRKLYFTAGIVDEAHGLFGFIHPAEQENSDD